MGSYLNHFPEGYSKKLREYIHDNLFKHYIFTNDSAFCTHCNSSFKFSDIGFFGEFHKNGKPKHNSVATCPICGEKCTVKNAGRGYKTLVDEVYCIYFEKSEINPNAIIARGIYAVRDYSKNYRTIKTHYATKAFYYYEMGNTVMFDRYVSYWGGQMYEGSLGERNKLSSLIYQYPLKKANIVIDYYLESIEEAVKGTPFQYSCYKVFNDYGGYVTYFDLYARYPVIEKLIKIGFKDVVIAKLNNNPTYGAINWNANTIQKTLRLNKDEIKLLKSIEVDCRLLKLYQIAKKYNAVLNSDDLKFLNNKNVYPDVLNDLLKYVSFKKLFNYIRKQSEVYNLPFNYLLQDYRDYISDCIDLEKNVKEKSVLFPKNLREAHEKTTKLIRTKGSVILNRKIAERAKTLEKYYFEFNGLFIRPAASQTELIKEGNSLNHCVASRYSEDYANGKTNILFIRKTDAPNKSFYTVELKGNKIIQCRGKNNSDYSGNKDVKAFIEAFEGEKLTKKSSKIKVTA